MDYMRQFRQLREAKGLSREQLASRAGCHRNTVINIETGRPVKFRTIADLLGTMGYSEHSAEMKQVALLWLEATTGVKLSPGEAERTVSRLKTAYRRSVQTSQEALLRAVETAGLSREEIDLLTFAAQEPAVRAILQSVRALVSVDDDVHPARELRVAEK